MVEMDGGKTGIYLWLGIALLARSTPLIGIIIVVRAGLLLRRELGQSGVRVVRALIPFANWRATVPEPYWPAAERYRRRCAIAMAIVLFGMVTFIAIPKIMGAE
jgi:hypothetical protein